MPGLRRRARYVWSWAAWRPWTQSVQYAGRVPPEASADEDTRVWIGRVRNGHEAEHARFVEWLNGPEAQSVFRRRRLTEYLLSEEQDGSVRVVFKAPHTG